jgi:hypothetical protein
MKRILTGLFTAFVLFISVPTSMRADVGTNNSTSSEAKSNGAERAKILLSRLYKINEMDKTTLASADKMVLRREVKSIKQELKVLNGGVYLSVGAIIIILLILILLL